MLNIIFIAGTVGMSMRIALRGKGGRGRMRGNKFGGQGGRMWLNFIDFYLNHKISEDHKNSHPRSTSLMGYQQRRLDIACSHTYNGPEMVDSTRLVQTQAGSFSSSNSSKWCKSYRLHKLWSSLQILGVCVWPCRCHMRDRRGSSAIPLHQGGLCVCVCVGVGKNKENQQWFWHA